jgi:hypothetical protein
MHQGSLFLAFASILNLVMAIPLALCIYRFVFGITYFGSIHLSSLMIIVGIGSDDILVWHDFWA